MSAEVTRRDKLIAIYRYLQRGLAIPIEQEVGTFWVEGYSERPVFDPDTIPENVALILNIEVDGVPTPATDDEIEQMYRYVNRIHPGNRIDMNWQTLSTEEKNTLVHEQVLRKPVLCPGKIRLVRNPLVWYCDECIQSWGVSEVSDYHTFTHFLRAIPNYTESMDAAWTVLQKIAARYVKGAEFLDDVFWKFRRELLNDSGDEIWTATELLLDMATWTPETICLAALKAIGEYIE